MFKSLIPAVVIVSALAAPTFVFAQSNDNGPVTRAEVKAQLVQLEKAGYNPSSDQINYPANIQAAQARVDAQNQAATSYGPSTSGTSAAGVRSSVAPARNTPGSVFFGH
ncbi:hypothetical protein AX768_24370 [Burkholderia sp. PAMC 28687]|uniref:DUF4148 domain-containing protein n=1 Tax=Burkholderia sp. PAMC 28687 TaxID=1795874 RepID=UPI000786534C|nr:DUF4148 domain-containing protein [Burkholderia sp. PAMC 28687]AMM17356.1 hypothetical protein AX768_24370 [Burkholderia sp. PAMC 28687]